MASKVSYVSFKAAGIGFILLQLEDQKEKLLAQKKTVPEDLEEKIKKQKKLLADCK